MTASRGTPALAWWQKPMRIAALQCETSTDPFRILDGWDKLGFNVEQLLHISAHGWLGVYDPAKADLVRDYIAAAHRRGMRIIFYFGGHWLSDDLQKQHPDWRARRRDGTYIDHACLGNEGYVAWVQDISREVVALGADGVFLDGAYIAPDGCFCDRCASEFRESFGVELAQAEGDPDLRHKVTELKMRVVDRYLAAVRKAVHAANPQAVLYVNMPGLHPLRTRGVDIRRHLAFQDLAGAEGGFMYYSPASQIPMWKAGAVAKLLATVANGKPTVNFCAADHKPWNLSMISAAEATITYCQAIAHGSSVWFGLHTPRFEEAIASPTLQAVGRMNQFIARHEEYYTATRSSARVAVLFSYDTAEEYRYSASDSDFLATQKDGNQGVTGDFSKSWMGCYEALTRSHIPFDMIDDTAASDPAFLQARYDLVILPTVACMSDAVARALEQFVTAGGNLLAAHECGAYDERGRRRAEPALSKVLGVSWTGKTVAMKRFSYLSPTEAGKEILWTAVNEELQPAPPWALEVELAGAKALARFHEPVDRQYRPLTPTTSPAITLHHYGQGQAAYIAGTWFETYMIEGFPSYRALTQQLVRRLSRPVVEVEGLPGSVEVVVRVQPHTQRMIIHLINMTGDMTRPMEKIMPIPGPAFLTVYTDAPMRSARALMSSRPLPLDAADGKVRIEVPGLNDYEVIVLD